ncbi:multiple pdz domain protein, partial [Plakobranchus ocellatus]
LPHAPVIPTHQLEDHMEHFNAVMAMEPGEHEQHLHNLHLQNMHIQQLQQQQLQQQQQQQQTLLGSVQVHPQPTEVIQDLSDVDVFEVDLMKDSNGLGITIAGYVGGDHTPDEISGIFVKSITEGSTAALDGRVHVNDQIIEVDGNSLQGFSNHQAVEVLRNTGQLVRLKLVRFRHGPKYDKLQEYLAQANQLVAAPVQTKESSAVSNPTYDLESKQVDLEEVQLITEDYNYKHFLKLYLYRVSDGCNRYRDSRVLLCMLKQSKISTPCCLELFGGVGGTVASESALRSAGTFLSRFEPRHRRPGLTEGPKA